MLVVPSEVFYQPKFTYIWTLAIGRFPDALLRRQSRETALREIARCFLAGAGMTMRGELARVSGLSRPEAGRGNRALVAEGYARMPSNGEYWLIDHIPIASLLTKCGHRTDANGPPRGDRARDQRHRRQNQHRR